MLPFPPPFLTRSGRLSRASFFWLSCASVVVFALLFALLQKTLGSASTLLLYPLIFWLAFALSSRRLHDLGQSSWRLLMLLIPFFGPAWIFFILLFKKGIYGTNAYGDDPLQQQGDYLSVNIHQGAEHA